MLRTTNHFFEALGQVANKTAAGSEKLAQITREWLTTHHMFQKVVDKTLIM